ncbi:MAG: hypothetical protein EZS28_033280 [Streblomastix strix]|uniref:Uncharacterized protein n=1 Tax=Streblomastix strix TaxID=222440 RepID=A0A5J4ULN9_9EUKA|nr:MAG: hypothetical protein EZS28_033280 [Streblomastix strix]
MAQRNLRTRKSKSQAQILDELLKRFDKNKKQTDIAEDSMKLSIQTILKQPKRLNLTEFVDEIQIQVNDREIPVIIENADKIQYGGKTIQDWFDDYIAKELQKGKRRQNIRLPRAKLESASQPYEQTAQTEQIKFPFKSKIKAYEQVHGIKLKQEQIASSISVPDYQIKQLPEKFGRPYFSYEFGSWEIDIVFSMNPDKSQEDIEKALQNLVQIQNVTHIRGDGEKGFAVLTERSSTTSGVASSALYSLCERSKEQRVSSITPDQRDEVPNKVGLAKVTKQRGRQYKYQTKEEAQQVAKYQRKQCAIKYAKFCRNRQNA